MSAVQVRSVAPHYAPITQLEEYQTFNLGVTSSSLVRCTKYGTVAQQVEQRTENPRVAGSIPVGFTKICACSSVGRIADF